MKTKATKMLAALLAVTTAGLTKVNAEFPDLSKTGSISVEMTDNETKETVGGGSLELIQVASVEVDNGFVFVYTKDFSELTYDIGEDASLDSALAENISLFADNNSITGETKIIDGSGKASWSDLELGLYLVRQPEGAEGYKTIDPFLVTIPYRESEDSEYVYDVNASPKLTLEKYTPLETNDPPVLKVVKGEGAPTDTLFQFKMKRQSDEPMPANTAGSTSSGGPVVSQTTDEIIIQAKAGNKEYFGTTTYTKPGEYYYTIEEVDTGEKNYQYDDTVYWIKVTIIDNDGELERSEYLVKKGGAEGTEVYKGTDPSAVTFEFTNTYTPPTPTPTPTPVVTPVPTPTPTPTTPEPPKEELAFTGQLWWPVWVLLAAGGGLLIKGLRTE